jgi:uncharacterized protein (TIGR00725 family)
LALLAQTENNKNVAAGSSLEQPRLEACATESLRRHRGEKMAQPVYVAVIGGSDLSPETTRLAREVGREVAERGAVLLCGGLGGVMAAAAQGAQDAGGVSLGILPDGDRRRANPYLTYAIATNLGHARNVLIAHSADAVIAVGGSYGTVSEAAIALKLGKPVVALNVTWDLAGLKRAATPTEAVALAWGAVKR